VKLFEEISELERKRKTSHDEKKLQQTREKLDEKLNSILADVLAGKSEILVKEAEALGWHLKNKGLTTSQIRNIFSEVKRMHEFNKDKLNLLRPKLAYTVGRHKEKVKDLQLVLDSAIQKVNDENDFRNFQYFFEAILAYHRYYGGGE
jgi:CRISPR-associated protein Csm2